VRDIRVDSRINVNGDLLLDVSVGVNPSFVINVREALILIKKLEEKL